MSKPQRSVKIAPAQALERDKASAILRVLGTLCTKDLKQMNSSGFKFQLSHPVETSRKGGKPTSVNDSISPNSFSCPRLTR